MARRGSAVGGPSPTMPKPPKAKGPTPAKAKAILSDGEVRGNPLTKPQKGLFGAIAGGAVPKPGGPLAGMSPPAASRPKPMAIGQRPQLGARTKTAMRGKTPFNR
jgi:hypothetical protein